MYICKSINLCVTWRVNDVLSLERLYGFLVNVLFIVRCAGLLVFIRHFAPSPDISTFAPTRVVAFSLLFLFLFFFMLNACISGPFESTRREIKILVFLLLLRQLLVSLIVLITKIVTMRYKRALNVSTYHSGKRGRREK